MPINANAQTYAYFAVSVDGVSAYIWVANTSDNTRAGLIPLDVHRRDVPLAIKLTPDGSRLYVLTDDNDRLYVIDAVNLEVLTTIESIGGQYLDITPDGTRAYIGDAESDGIKVLDTDPESPTYHTLLTTLPIDLPEGFGFISISPNGESLWTVYDAKRNPTPPEGFNPALFVDAPGIAIINTDRSSGEFHTITMPAISGDYLTGLDLDFSPTGDTAYLIDLLTNRVHFFDTTSLQYTSSVVTNALFSFLIEGVLTPDGSDLYVSSLSISDPEGKVFIVDTAERILTDTVSFVLEPNIFSIPLNPFPWQLDITPEGTSVYTGNLFFSSHEIDTGSNSVVDAITLASYSSKVDDSISAPFDEITELADLLGWGFTQEELDQYASLDELFKILHFVSDIAIGEYQPPQPLGAGTPGYWKNHAEDWPVENIEIGGAMYTKAKAIDLMKGNRSKDVTFILFRALVAAKLNAMLPGNVSGCVDQTIGDADIWMFNYPVESNVDAGGDNSPWRTGEPLYLILDDYNNGLLCLVARD